MTEARVPLTARAGGRRGGHTPPGPAQARGNLCAQVALSPPWLRPSHGHRELLPRPRATPGVWQTLGSPVGSSRTRLGSVTEPRVARGPDVPERELRVLTAGRFFPLRPTPGSLTHLPFLFPGSRSGSHPTGASAESPGGVGAALPRTTPPLRDRVSGSGHGFRGAAGRGGVPGAHLQGRRR